MGKTLLIGAVVVGILAIGAYSKPELLAAGNSETRYVMKETKDGFLRMDTTTGHVSLCHEKANSWVCEAVADDREALENEIARLDKRIGVLKRHIKKSKTNHFNFPSDEEVDEVLGFFERFIKRFRNFSDLFEDPKKADDSI